MNEQASWILGCPAPKAGRVVEGYYNAGPIIADDRKGPTPEDTKVQIVTGITEADYEQYILDLKAAGHIAYLENRIAEGAGEGAA